MKGEYKVLIATYLIFVAIKTVLTYLIPAPTIFADSYVYAKMAYSFFYNGNFLVHGVVSRSPFLYSAALSIAYLFKDMLAVYTTMKIINVLILSTIIFPIYFLARDFLSYRKALLVSILSSVLASNFVMPSYIMSENLFYPLFAFTIFFIYRAFKTQKLSYFALSGLFVGLSFLTRMIGIALALVPIVIVLITYFYIRKSNKQNIPLLKVILHYVIALLSASPLLIKNILNFGFSLRGLVGGYGEAKATVVAPSLAIKITGFVNYLFLYSGYLILASGILLGLYFIVAYKVRDKNFKLLFFISLLAIIFTILLAANHSSSSISPYSSPFQFFTGRPLGRYVDSVLPFILLGGFVAFFKQKEIKISKYISKIILITTLILAISTQLTIASLFPLNNQNLSWLGTLQYALEFIIFNKLSFEPVFYWTSFIVMLAILASLPIIAYKLRKTKKIILILFIFLLANSIFTYGLTYWNSSTNWYNNEQIQLGLTFNKLSLPPDTKVLFDETGCISPDLRSGSICTPRKGATLAGFFMNADICIGNVKEAENFNYVVSRQKLDMQVQAKTKNEIYLYKVSPTKE